jgi:STE24 endopeptidase
MVQIYLIATCVVLALASRASPRAAIDPSTAAHPWILAAFPAALIILAAINSIVCARLARRMDSTGWADAGWRAARVVINLRFVALAAFAFACFAMNWPGTIRAYLGNPILIDEALAAAPMILFLAWGWWSAHPIERRMSEARLYRALSEALPVPDLATRTSAIVQRARESLGLVLIPAALATAAHECLTRATPTIAHALAARGVPPPALDAALTVLWLVAVILIFILAPALIRRTWDASPLGPGPSRDAIDLVLRARPTRIRGPLLLATHAGTINALVLGTLFPFRYMLFTRTLLEALSPREVAAVAAHEIGHIRLAHIPWLCAAVFAAALASSWLLIGLATLFDLDPASDRATIAFALASLPLIALVFGFVSRRFEWQADAFAAKALSEISSPLLASAPYTTDNPDNSDTTDTPAAQGAPTPLASSNPSDRPRITAHATLALIDALQTVADVAGVRAQARSFRHGSIAYRQARLCALTDSPLGTLRIDRICLAMKIVAALALLAGIAPLAIELAAAF